MDVDTHQQFDSNLLHLAQHHSPHWGHETIKAFPESWFRENERFAVRHYWCGEAPINVFRVVGTRHPDYQGLAWSDFLRVGKRMPSNHELWDTNPVYYTNHDKKLPVMSFLSLDGQDWYVDDDGNHRTCIARFDFHAQGIHTLAGVSLSDWRIDEAFRDAFLATVDVLRHRKPAWRLELNSAPISRQDNPGWKLDEFALSARLDTGGDKAPAGAANEMDLGALLAFKRDIERPAWRRLFGL